VVVVAVVAAGEEERAEKRRTAIRQGRRGSVRSSRTVGLTQKAKVSPKSKYLRNQKSRAGSRSVQGDGSLFMFTLRCILMGFGLSVSYDSLL